MPKKVLAMKGLIKMRGIKTRLVAVTAALVLASSVATFDVTADSSAVCTATSLNVRSGAGTSYSRVGMIYSGDSITVTGSTTASDGSTWYKISYTNSSGTKVTGYASAKYIEITGDASSSTGSEGSSTALSDSEFEAYMDEQGFPESYKPYLREMHEVHPNWVFTAQKTGLDWDTVLSEECVIGRNLVHSSALASWKSCEKGAYDVATDTWYGLDGSWVAASEQIIAYYLDPRNFINDDYIFMFENLSYNPDVHNISGVEAILSGTFMSGSYTTPDTKETYTYAQTFMDAAEQSGISPYHLASRCRNEQGVNGAPQSLGTVSGYENYFNFFDIQAYATSTMTAAQMGAKYASTTNATYLLPWTNQYKSIVGGSIYLSNGYISKEQDTLYLQKFDVVDGGNGLYYHQYMTCVFGQANEAKEMKNAYSSDVLASALEFKIPVYENMPDSASAKPTSYGDNNNLLKSLKAVEQGGSNLITDFNRYTNSYTLSVDEDVSYITVSGAAYNSSATISGAGKIALDYGKNTIEVKVTAASGDVRTYKIVVTRAGSSSGDITGDVDDSGVIDINDALTIMNYTSGKYTLTSAEVSRADVDSSGKVDLFDAMKIMQYISGKIESF